MSFLDIILFWIISSILLILIFYFITKKTGINIFTIAFYTFLFLIGYYFFHSELFNITETFKYTLLLILIIFYLDIIGICILFEKNITHN